MRGKEQDTTSNITNSNQEREEHKNKKPNKTIRHTRAGEQNMRKKNASNRDHDQPTDTFEQHFGDKIRKKTDNVIRIAALNTRTLPIENRDPQKYDLLKLELINNQYDIIGLSEINHNWTMMETRDQMHHQMRWWKNKTIQRSWMQTKELKQRQTGGTATIIANDYTSNCETRGSDNRNMGRWSWVTIKDTAGEIKTTIITIYQPVRNVGIDTVLTQQASKIRKDRPHLTESVHELYVTDLEELIQTKIEDNHQIIVMGDFNIDTSKQKEKIVTMMEKHNITNAIQRKHGNTTATRLDGTKPLDGIFCSQTIPVARGGHRPGDIALSDHKLVWVDIPTHAIIGQNDTIIRPINRKLQSDHPGIKKRYNLLLERQLQTHKAEQIASNLKQAIANREEDRYQQLYEKLDRIRRRAIQHAESNCTKTKRGQVPFSPELTKISGEITMWKLLYKRHTAQRKYRPRWRMITRKAKRWNFNSENLQINDLKIITTELHKAVRKYKHRRKDAKILRIAYLEKKAEAIMEEKGGNEKNHFKRLLQIEEAKDTHKRIKFSQKETNSPLTYIEKDNEERTIINGKEEMEEAIRDANIHKLLQANNTPLREEPLASMFKETTLDYETWEKILDPSVPLPDNLERGTKLWFRQMRDPTTTIPTSAMQFTDETYKTSWKKMKERTSSHPGLHFGHMKAIDSTSPLAAKVHAILANTPLQTGYSPTAWKSCTNTMLKKKKNDLRPSKLRLVTLMDTTFNHNNKYIGKQLLENGEKYNTLATEQYGSRKHKSAAEHALNKVLTLDISRQTREAIIFTANDAVSCYDRVVLIAAYCTMIKYGIPKQAARSMITTLATMAHYIRTAKGDSIRHYGGQKWIRLPHGLGQGNGSGPGVWACVSSPLFEALRHDGYGIQTQAPISLVLLNITGFSFVDDADLVQSMGDLQSEQELFEKAQMQLTVWEQLLRTTGGAISPEKSDWVFIRYKWNKGRWSYTKELYPQPLQVRDKDKNQKNLRQLTITEARETLGVWIAADGNWKVQTQKLTEKADQWATKLQQGHLNTTDSMIALQTTIQRSLQYCLPATYLTEEQCRQIMSKLLMKVLPKLKVMRTMNRIAVHLPTKYNGLGIQDLYTAQGIEHIKMILQHGGTTSATGTLLQTSIEHHILEAGSANHIFLLPKQMISYLTHTWIKNTLQFMHVRDIHIEGEGLELRKWHQQDTSIMDNIVKLKLYNTNQLKGINNCRMYLKVVMMSDITKTDGRLYDDIFNIVPILTLSTEAYAWPDRPCPHDDDKELWRQAIQRLHIRTTQPTTKYRYDTITQDANIISSWRYDKCTEELWETYHDYWRLWTKAGGPTRSAQLYEPTTTYRMYSSRHWDIPILTDKDNKMKILQLLPQQISMTESTTEPWAPMGTFRTGLPMETFLQEIQDGTAGCVSDGTAKDGKTAAAFTSLHKEGTHECMTGHMKIPGRQEDQDSYRGELAGLLGIITTVNFICILHHVTTGRVTVGCDNKSALTTAFHRDHLSTKNASRDILQAIHFQRKISPIEWTTKHVYGHQDDKENNDKLDHWAQANIAMDHKADIAREQGETPQHTKLAGENWRLKLHNKYIMGHIKSSIELHCYHPIAVDYWSQRGRINKENQKHADWIALRRATGLTPRARQVFLTKQGSGFLPTGVMMQRRKEWDNPHCPMCHQNEDTHHILKCTSPQGTDHYDRAFTELDQWLEKTTSPEIGQAIYSLYDDYRNDKDEQILYDNWSPILCNAVTTQWKLGTTAFTAGILAKQWVYAQDEHYMYTNKRKHSADLWVARLISRLWRLHHDVWKHRCHFLHKKEQQEALLKDGYNLKLRDLLQHPPPPSMPAEDRRHFIKLDIALRLPIHRKRRLTTILQNLSDAHELRSRTKSAQCMRMWLATAHPT